MLNIFKRLWQVNWAEQWQYRANLAMYILYWLVSPIIYLSVWTSIATVNGDVKGLTANDFITYYMILLIVDQLTSNIIIGERHRSQDVKHDAFDSHLDRACASLQASI